MNTKQIIGVILIIISIISFIAVGLWYNPIGFILSVLVTFGIVGLFLLIGWLLEG